MLLKAESLKLRPFQEMNDFYDMIYEVVRQIPKGRVTSYGAIAKYLGSAQSSRMVGWAMNNSHSQKPYVPAHRVVNRLGQLSGAHHFPPPGMEALLKKEGIKVKKETIVNFNKVFWDPATELEL